jgi:hypothetical protein
MNSSVSCAKGKHAISEGNIAFIFRVKNKPVPSKCRLSAAEMHGFISRKTECGHYYEILKSSITKLHCISYLHHACYLFGLLFNPEDGGDISLRNVGWLSVGRSDKFLLASSAKLCLVSGRERLTTMFFCLTKLQLAASYMACSRLILRHWKWERYVPPKHWLTEYTTLYPRRKRSQ